MAAYKVLAVTLLATLASCEPPIQGSAPYNYQPPSSSYGAPSAFSSPSQSYSAPGSSYSAPSTSYGAPSQSYSAPSTSYGAPQHSYNVPSQSYGAPSGYDGSYDNGHGHGHGHDNEVPKSYEFGYSVKDAHSGNDYDRKEMSDGNTVRGEYRVQLPDGRTQIVTYHADWQTGFHADVRYEGEAKYPEPTNNYKSQDSYTYNAPSGQGSDFSGSLTGFHGNNNYDNYNNNPSTSYGTPQFH